MVVKTDFDDIRAELSIVPPAEFTAARNEQARLAKEHDAQLSAKIAKLRRPTVAAWLVNLVAYHRRDELEDYLHLGDKLRRAQRNASADEIRTLSAERQKRLLALMDTAVELAGNQPADAAVAEANSTLHAALADRDLAEEIRAGALIRAASYAGFGDIGFAPTVVPSPKTGGQDRRRDHKTAERAVQDATAAVEKAHHDEETAERTAAELEQQVETARREWEDLRRQHQAAVAARTASKEATRFAERSLASARAQLDRLERD